MEARIMRVRAILNRLADGHREPSHSGKGRFWNLSRDEFVNGPIYGKTPIVPGQPQNSFLLKILAGPTGPPDGNFPQMPINGPYATPEEIAFITQWIQDGAPDVSHADAPQYAKMIETLCSSGWEDLLREPERLMGR